jgi:hypothetical protein
MLTKLKKELSNRTTIGDLHAAEPLGPVEEEEEEVDNTWQPSDVLKDTIKSLKVFEKFEGMSKKEVRDSYTGFDAWLKSELYRIVAIEKAAEDEKTWGDLK